MLVGALRPSQFPQDEIHIQHNGTVWLVASRVDVQHQFEHLSEAMNYANEVRDQQRGEDRPRVILHRAQPGCRVGNDGGTGVGRTSCGGRPLHRRSALDVAHVDPSGGPQPPSAATRTPAVARH